MFFAGSYSLPSVGVTRQAIGRSSSGFIKYWANSVPFRDRAGASNERKTWLLASRSHDIEKRNPLYFRLKATFYSIDRQQALAHLFQSELLKIFHPMGDLGVEESTETRKLGLPGEEIVGSRHCLNGPLELEFIGS